MILQQQYRVNTLFILLRQKHCLRLHCNAVNKLLYVYEVNIYQFKAKDTETKPYLLCLESVSKHFTADNMEKAGLKKLLSHFSVGHDTIDISDMVNILEYLIKKIDIA